MVEMGGICRKGLQRQVAVGWVLKLGSGESLRKRKLHGAPPDR